MPKPIFHIPRSLLIVLLIMITATMLVGTFRAFAPARAKTAASPTPVSMQIQTPTETDFDFDSGDVPPTETPILPTGMTPADTTGIIAQAIVVVAIIIFGAVMGWRMSTPHLSRKTKK
jgi:hypothetical protein